MEENTKAHVCAHEHMHTPNGCVHTHSHIYILAGAHRHTRAHEKVWMNARGRTCSPAAHQGAHAHRTAACRQE